MLMRGSCIVFSLRVRCTCTCTYVAEDLIASHPSRRISSAGLCGTVLSTVVESLEFGFLMAVLLKGSDKVCRRAVTQGRCAYIT